MCTFRVCCFILQGGEGQALLPLHPLVFCDCGLLLMLALAVCLWGAWDRLDGDGWFLDCWPFLNWTLCHGCLWNYVVELHSRRVVKVSHSAQHVEEALIGVNVWSGYVPFADHCNGWREAFKLPLEESVDHVHVHANLQNQPRALLLVEVSPQLEKLVLDEGCCLRNHLGCDAVDLLYRNCVCGRDDAEHAVEQGETRTEARQNEALETNSVQVVACVCLCRLEHPVNQFG